MISEISFFEMFSMNLPAVLYADILIQYSFFLLHFHPKILNAAFMIGIHKLLRIMDRDKRHTLSLRSLE